jgi:hypothetical protein
MADYVPNTDDALITWLTNLKTKLTPAYAATLGISPARVTQIGAWCDALIASIQNVAQKKTDWLSASAAKQTQSDQSIGGLRMEINQWKANPAMTDAISADLQIVGTSAPFDAEGYQANITAQAFSGYVRIKFKKMGADGINLYSRIKDQLVWKFVSRDTNSPYDDHTPVATPGTAEVREYQAFGILNDEQIGQGSDIIAVTVAG